MTPAQAPGSAGPRSEGDTPWASHLRAADRALAGGQPRLAARHWDDAQLAALAADGWRPPLAVGAARLRLGSLAGDPRGAAAGARRLYVTALFRASRQHALDGLVAVAEAFAALGDHDMVEECAAVADLIPAGEAEHRCAQARLAGLARAASR